MTRVQAREFDQVLLRFDTLTIEMSDSRKKVEKVVERMENGRKHIEKKHTSMSQDCD